MLYLFSYISEKVKVISVKAILTLVAFLFCAMYIVNHFASILPTHFIHLFSMFLIGSVFFLWQDKINLPHTVIVVGLSLFIFSSLNVLPFNRSIFFVLYVVLLPFMVFYVAYIPQGIVRRFNELGDYSYGIYIYAFPVQQSIAAIMPGVSVVVMIMLSSVLTLALAIMSWHLIEKGFCVSNMRLFVWLISRGAFCVIKYAQDSERSPLVLYAHSDDLRSVRIK